LHPTLVALTPLHVLPHAPQAVTVFRVVHVLPQSVSRQVQEPFWQSGLGCVQVALFVQSPALLHDCGVLLLH
jgi:hypothetical protein